MRVGMYRCAGVVSEVPRTYLRRAGTHYVPKGTIDKKKTIVRKSTLQKKR